MRVVEKVFYRGSVSLKCTELPGPVKSPPPGRTWHDPTDIPDPTAQGVFIFWEILNDVNLPLQPVFEAKKAEKLQQKLNIFEIYGGRKISISLKNFCHL